MINQHKPKLIRFGPFELDLATRDLQGNDKKTRLPEQQALILEMLLTRNGDLVSREEIRNRLWPQDTVVEFDRSINAAIKKLRAALGDSAESPQFIETIARRGYRLIVPIVPILSSTAEAEIQKTTVPDPHIFTGWHKADDLSGAERVEETAIQAGSLGWRNRVLFGSLMILLSIGLLFAYAPWSPSPHQHFVHVSRYVQITHDGQAKFLRATDGNRLYFNTLQQEEIKQVSISGGTIASVAVEVELPWLEDISPDGSTLLITSDIHGGSAWSLHPLWTAAILGGPPRQIADAIAATWSPDGKFVTYSNGNGDIYQVKADGSNPTRLASVGGQLTFLRWAPDGSSIRFVRDKKIWEISSDGLNLHLLFPDGPKESEMCCGQWGADGDYYYISDAQIWVLSTKKNAFQSGPSSPVRLTSDPIHWDMPIPSRDGMRVFASGQTPRGELVRFDPKSRVFRPFLSGISAEFATFSKDGRSVAYVSYPEGVLWKANADGSEPIQLTEPSVYPRMPNWSPDGRSIVFMTEMGPDAHVSAYMVPSLGGSIQKLIPRDSQTESYPHFSPDGRRVAFSTSGENGRDEQSVIRVLDLVTKEIETIPGSAGLFDPHWSPDGRYLFGVSSNRSFLKLLDLRDQHWSTIHASLVGSPEWSADSSFIYFLSWQTDSAIFRVNVRSAGLERVSDLYGFHYTGYYNRWMGLDPVGAPLMMRDIGSNDIYSLILAKN